MSKEGTKRRYAEAAQKVYRLLEVNPDLRRFFKRTFGFGPPRRTELIFSIPELREYLETTYITAMEEEREEDEKLLERARSGVLEQSTGGGRR